MVESVCARFLGLEEGRIIIWRTDGAGISFVLEPQAARHLTAPGASAARPFVWRSLAGQIRFVGLAS